MTALVDTPARYCERGSGLLIRDCQRNGCVVCEEVVREFRELHAERANAYLSNRSAEERRERVAGIERQIQRYETWL